MKSAALWIISISITLLALGLAQETSTQETEADVTITIDNRGASAYVVTEVSGAEAVAELTTDNSTWTLEVGKRYRIINNGGAGHPLQLRGEEGVLLSQLSGTGSASSLQSDEAIAFESDEAGISFTLTEELAQVLTSYRCAYHPGMTGSIITSAR